MLNKLLLFFLIFSLIIDPTGEFFRFKYISTILSFLIFGIYFIKNKKYKFFNKTLLVYLILFAILMPVYGLCITYLNGQLIPIIDSSYVGFSLLLLISFPVIFSVENEIFFKVLVLALRCLSLITITILFSFIYDTDSIGISQFFIDKKSMLVGNREYAGIQTYFLYFTASPLLIFLVTFDSNNLINKISFKNVLFFIISSVSIFLTGTRFSMLVAIVVLPLMFFIKNISYKKIINYSFLLILLIIVLFQNSFISSFFNSNESSNSVKLGYFETYSSLFCQPKILILGQGFNAYDSSTIFRNMLINFGNEGVKTELTFIEILRVFGFFFGTLLMIFLISIPFILYQKIEKLNFLIVAFILYLINASINPYIFSTNGVLVFLFFLILIKKDIKFNLNK